MTTTLSVIVKGVETQLDDIGALIAHAGWGMPPMTTWNNSAPGQHGATWGGYRLTPRHGTLTFRMRTVEQDTMYALRQTIQDLFNPLNGEIILKFLTPTGTRHFACHYFDSNLDWKVESAWAQGYSVSLEASDPTCYDPTGVDYTFSLGGGSGGTIPMAIPMLVGASTIDQIQNADTDGNWITYPLIRITGPIDDCIIENTSTGEILDFTGDNLAAGSYYDIDLRYGLKTITDNTGANKISTITTASNLSTFHIGPDAEVGAGGINSIRVTGINVTEATKIELSFFDRYLGQ